MFLFSTAGRITRGKFWLAVLIYGLVLVVAAIVGFVLITEPPSDLAALILYIGGGLLFLSVYFSSIAVAIKRLHDRDKIGWWSVPFVVLPGLLQSASNGLVSPTTSLGLSIVSGVLGLWGLVELGLLRGTVGPNRFGDDPLAPVVPTAPGPAAP
jgi:uncharacterized membrane protein YhaH (DUF805 family)